MQISEVDRVQLTAELEAAKTMQSRCMGGVDPLGCVVACRRITELRDILRNDSAMMEHLQRVVSEPRPLRSKTTLQATQTA